MASLQELTAQGARIAAHRGAARAVVDAATWILAARELQDGRLSLLGLWGDQSAVHMALLDPAAKELAVLTLDCPARRFPSVGQFHPPAIRLERTARDLYGLVPGHAPDTRPWLDHAEP